MKSQGKTTLKKVIESITMGMVLSVALFSAALQTPTDTEPAGVAQQPIQELLAFND